MKQRGAVYCEGGSSLSGRIKAKESTPIIGDLTSDEFTINAGDTKNITINIDAAKLKDASQNKVKNFGANWEWTFVRGTDETFLINSSQNIYTVIARPLSPWICTSQPYDEGEIGYIWTDLLDVCCSAYKSNPKSGLPNDLEHVRAYTLELNNNRAFKYDVDGGGASYYTTDLQMIKLQKYLKDRMGTSAKVLNCTDCANIVAMEAVASGIDCTMGIMTGLSGFACNQIQAIGYTVWKFPFEFFVFSWTNVPGIHDDRLRKYLKERHHIDWISTAIISKSNDGKTIYLSQDAKTLSLTLNDEVSEVLCSFTNRLIARMENGELKIFDKGGFSYHQVAVIGSAVRSKQSSVFDACLKLDEGSYPGKSESNTYTKKPMLPINYTFSETEDLYVNVPVTTPYNRPYYRERLVEDRSLCSWLSCPIPVAGIATTTTITIAKEAMYMEGNGYHEYFDIVKKRFGLDENPLPKKPGLSVENAFPDFKKIPGIDQFELEEDYGEQKVYSAIRDGNKYRVDIHKAADEQKAYLVLIRRLAFIQNPGINRHNDLGDIAFTIDDSYAIAVRNNVVITVSGRGAVQFAKEIMEQL